MPVSTDEELQSVLEKRTIAVVGCSGTPGKAAHAVPAYLQRAGYEVIPVNPHHEEVLGRRAYASLEEVEEDVDIVDVFRPSEEVAGIVDATLERRERRGDVEVVWLQLDIHDDEAVARAEEAGLTVVEDRCIKVEHERLLG